MRFKHNETRAFIPRGVAMCAAHSLLRNATWAKSARLDGVTYFASTKKDRFE